MFNATKWFLLPLSARGEAFDQLMAKVGIKSSFFRFGPHMKPEASRCFSFQGRLCMKEASMPPAAIWLSVSECHFANVHFGQKGCLGKFFALPSTMQPQLWNTLLVIDLTHSTYILHPASDWRDFRTKYTPSVLRMTMLTVQVKCPDWFSVLIFSFLMHPFRQHFGSLYRKLASGWEIGWRSKQWASAVYV